MLIMSCYEFGRKYMEIGNGMIVVVYVLIVGNSRVVEKHGPERK